jgi:hypothetical protein
MSKQSDRKREKLRKAKDIIKLSKTQENGQNQSPKPDTEPKRGIQNPETATGIQNRRLINRPALIAIVGTVFLGVSAFVQLYSHTLAIWLLCLGLVAYAQAIRVEIIELSTSSKPANLIGIIACALALVFCATLQIIECNKQKLEPAQKPNFSTTGSAIVSNKIELPAAMTALAEKLQSTSDLLSQVTSQRDAANAALIAAQSATEPRTIKRDQRRDFITLLADASKISLPVVVGNNDSETEHFAEQFMEMLGAAGFGTNAPISLPPPEQNIIFVTNGAVAIIPPLGGYSREGITYISGLFLSRLDQDKPQRQPNVFALLSDTNLLSGRLNPSEPPTFMVLKATKNNANGGELLAYHPTDNQDSIIIGVCNALIREGISVGFASSKGILQDGKVGFFIPQKFY